MTFYRHSSVIRLEFTQYFYIKSNIFIYPIPKNPCINNAAQAAPTNGAIPGTMIPYCQSLSALFLIGKMAWAIRGPMSRARFMAKPVGPPSPIPMAQTKSPTPIGTIPGVFTSEIAKIPEIKIKVSKNSTKKFRGKLRTAGAVENKFRIVIGEISSAEAAKWSAYMIQTITAPTTPPKTSATEYGMKTDHDKLPNMH